MPIAFGAQTMPAPYPRNPKWYESLGHLQGTVGRQVTDALLAALTGGAYSGRLGQVPTSPTPQRPGSLTFPSGAQTQTSPLEMAQIQQMGGIPTRQGDVVPLGQTQTGGVQYTPPTRFGIRPDLNSQIQQANLDYMQSLTKLLQPQQQTSGTTPIPPAPLSSPLITSKLLKGLYAQAQGGDTKALDSIRLLALEKNDPEAITLLQSLGEL